MKILFTVCGRGGSKGLKDKNLRPFLGKPLFAHTLRAIELYAEKWPCEHAIVVSTDSPAFIDILVPYKDVAVRDRPAEFARDTSPKMDAIRDALLYAESIKNTRFDVIVDLDITSPIRTAGNIREAIELKKADRSLDVVFSVTDARRNPYFNMVKEEGGYYRRVIEAEFAARQQAPQVFDMNASIYVYEREFLCTGAKSPLEGKAGIVWMPDTGIIDIDTLENFELMEIVARHFADTKEEYAKLFSPYVL